MAWWDLNFSAASPAMARPWSRPGNYTVPRPKPSSAYSLLQPGPQPMGLPDMPYTANPMPPAPPTAQPQPVAAAMLQQQPHPQPAQQPQAMNPRMPLPQPTPAQQQAADQRVRDWYAARMQPRPDPKTSLWAQYLAGTPMAGATTPAQAELARLKDEAGKNRLAMLGVPSMTADELGIDLRSPEQKRRENLAAWSAQRPYGATGPTAQEMAEAKARGVGTFPKATMDRLLAQESAFLNAPETTPMGVLPLMAAFMGIGATDREQQPVAR